MTRAGPRLRRSRAVVVLFDESTPRAVHFRTREAVNVDGLGFSLLRITGDWIAPEAIFDALAPEHPRDRIATELLRLIDAGTIVTAGTEAAEMDERLGREWAWGPTAGLFHFGIKDADYQGPEAVLAWIAERVRSKPRVPLYTTNDAYGAVRRLPSARAEGTLRTMRARRSSRAFADVPLPLDALADCLFAGLGIVGFFDTAIAGEGPLPLSMTPSGGARNPFEAFVLARSVAGLERGVYHYAAIDHTVGRVAERAVPSIASVLGGQSWFEDAAAVILLVASLERTMWKYPHPGGLRVVLIEAGHIAQNILLAATDHGLAAAPTCAISDAVAERVCGLDATTQAVVYAVALGVRSARSSAADPPVVLPNRALERPSSR